MEEADQKELARRYTVTCNECGSADVVFNLEPEVVYSEMTSSSGSLQIDCNACKKNDFFIYI